MVQNRMILYNETIYLLLRLLIVVRSTKIVESKMHERTTLDSHPDYLTRVR
jgi:hypothetical protein